MADAKASENKCGPTHHHACDCREAAVAKLVERVAKARAMLQHSGNSPHCSSCAAANEIDAALDEFHGRKQG